MNFFVNSCYKNVLLCQPEITVGTGTQKLNTPSKANTLHHLK